MTNPYQDLLRQTPPRAPEASPFQSELGMLAMLIDSEFPGLTAQSELTAFADFMPMNQLVLRIGSKSGGPAWDALHFRVDEAGTSISVLGGEKIGDVEAFRDYLKRVLAAGHLTRSLMILNQEALKPIEAVLRTQGPDALSAYDVVVRLDHATLERLRNADGECEVRLAPVSPAPIAPFVPSGIPYRFLTVEGGQWKLNGPPRLQEGEIVASVTAYEEPGAGFGAPA